MAIPAGALALYTCDEFNGLGQLDNSEAASPTLSEILGTGGSALIDTVDPMIGVGSLYGNNAGFATTIEQASLSGFDTPNQTICGWFKITDFSSTSILLGNCWDNFGTTSTLNCGQRIAFIASTNTINFGSMLNSPELTTDSNGHEDAGTTAAVAGTVLPVLDQWHFLAQVLDGNTTYGYIDGVLQGSVTSVQTPTTTSSDTLAMSFSVGTQYNSRTGVKNLAMTGNADQVRMYPRALTQAEVLELYQEGVPVVVPPVESTRNIWAGDDVSADQGQLIAIGISGQTIIG